jgi:hypothetical protein
MAINQTRKESRAGKVNDLGGLWRAGLQLFCGADFLDAVAFDEDGSVVNVVAGANVQEAGCFDEDDVGGFCFGIGLGSGAMGTNSQRQNNKEKSLQHTG